MKQKTQERIEFIKAHPNMDRTEVARILQIDSGYLTTFAKQHNLVLKTSRELLEEFIRKNSTLSGEEIVAAFKEETGIDYGQGHICAVARGIGIYIPNSRSKKIAEGTLVVKAPRKPQEAPVEKKEMKLVLKIEAEEAIQSPDYAKPRRERCPAIYTQSSSPYGFAEKLGVTARTK